MTKEAAPRVEGGKGVHLDSAGETKKVPRDVPKESFEFPSLKQSVMVYISYFIVVLFGYLDEFLRKIRIKPMTGQFQNQEVEVS